MTALPFIHPDDMPDVYALTGVGTCMEPMISDGASVAFSKRKAVTVGDIVGVIFRREAAPHYGAPGMIKRLAEPLPPPGFDAPIFLETLNPIRKVAVRSSDVLAIHAFIGVAQRAGDGRAALPASALANIERTDA
ncbi:hypothetical protein HRJ34_00060 [Rhizorhabdus wittichii]|uniref:Uncharacterized protein n=1 Tax=Rhizorhabdus wittichii TaxID=160791 RepID=A0A975HE43_9SPHN|nr:hypothetical protein [Rhizorhabdus wittichii]QTH21972.1 hypothetical protein HRJ34_00060 [Rhizorhabdus wittichii]